MAATYGSSIRWIDPAGGSSLGLETMIVSPVSRVTR